MYLWYRDFLESVPNLSPHISAFKLTDEDLMQFLKKTWINRFIYGALHYKNIKNSVTGNWTPVSRVTGGNTNHYTITESEIPL